MPAGGRQVWRHDAARDEGRVPESWPRGKDAAAMTPPAAWMPPRMDAGPSAAKRSGPAGAQPGRQAGGAGRALRLRGRLTSGPWRAGRAGAVRAVARRRHGCRLKTQPRARMASDRIQGGAFGRRPLVVREWRRELALPAGPRRVALPGGAADLLRSGAPRTCVAQGWRSSGAGLAFVGLSPGSRRALVGDSATPLVRLFWHLTG